MKAARLHEIATPFQIDDVPIPTPKGSDVLVRVRACGLVPNLKNVTHYYSEWFPFLPLPDLPATFGLDPAGEIAAVGEDVVGLKVGQRVYVNPARGCGGCAACIQGRPVLCASFAFAGYFGLGEGGRAVLRRYPYGGFAEYLVAPSYSIVPLDDEVSYDIASQFGYMGTAFAALRKGEVGPETTVLVNGATGTLGVRSVLLALGMGAPKVLVVARNKELLERVRAIDPNRIEAHSALDGPTRPWVLEHTEGLGADVLVEGLPTDAPTSATMDAANSIRRGGHILMIGGGNRPLDMATTWFQAMHATVSGSTWFTAAQGHCLSRMIAAGTMDVSHFLFDRFPLDQINDAVEEAHARPDGGFKSVLVTP